MTTFPPARFEADVRGQLERLGEVHAVFDERSQDSGNVSYGVRVGGHDWFVKTPGRPHHPRPEAFATRIALLRNAARVAESVQHPALPRGTVLVPGEHGPVLVRGWAPGELLRDPPDRRGDPTTALQRFRRLPVEEVLAALWTLVDAHVALAAAGWVAGDLYLGCLVYDAGARRLTLVDLDEYHRGPVVNRVGRMTGSLTVMAPEEQVLGAVVDQRSTVFTLARIALVLLGDGTDDPDAFRGGEALHSVLRRATSVAPDDRHRDVAAFAEAWRRAVSSSPPGRAR